MAVVSSEEGELDAAMLRELGMFVLFGAEISGADSAFLPSSEAWDSARPEAPIWLEVATAVALVAAFAYLVLCGG
jgi:hypothetical protein